MRIAVVLVAVGLILAGCARPQPQPTPQQQLAAAFPPCQAPTFKEAANCQIERLDLAMTMTAFREIGVAAPAVNRYREQLQALMREVDARRLTEAQAYDRAEADRRRMMADVAAAQAMLPPPPAAPRTVVIPVQQQPIYTPPRTTTCIPIGGMVSCQTM